MRGPDIIATVVFFKTEDGGRKGPTPSNRFKCPLEFESRFFDCMLHLESAGPIAPGATATVPITFLCPELIKPRLKIGSRFPLWEAGTKATGIVDSIL